MMANPLAKQNLVWKDWINIYIYQVLPSDPFLCFKWPFQGLSDLHLGYQKVNWKKLVVVMD